MQANTIMNKSLFRNFGGNTQSINSSIMIAHLVSNGVYNGMVYQKDKLIGQFELFCTNEHTAVQADVDLSVFVKSLQLDCGCKSTIPKYNLKDGGYVFFFVSGSDEGFHVELIPLNKKEKETNYSTRKLIKGDIVISLLMRPGVYEIVGSNKEKCTLTVETPKDLENYQQYLSKANTILLSEKGFNSKGLKIAPGQGIVITLQRDSNINVVLVKPTEVKEDVGSGSTHRWQKRPPFSSVKKK